MTASATCGGPTPDAPEVKEEQAPEPEKFKFAPLPQPVKTSAPVTG